MADEISKYITTLRELIFQCTSPVKGQPKYTSWHNHDGAQSRGPEPRTHPKPLDTLRTEQHGRHFAQNIFKCLFWMKIFESWFKCHWGLLVGALLTGNHHWFKYCLFAGHNLNQWWPCLLTHICVTRSEWVDALFPRAKWRWPNARQ